MISDPRWRSSSQVSLQIMRSHRLFLEGLPLGVTKGTALSWLAERLGIDARRRWLSGIRIMTRP